MASKIIKLSVAGKEIAASLEAKIGKDDLYGRVEHVVEQGGKRMERGWLFLDGGLGEPGNFGPRLSGCVSLHDASKVLR